MTPPWLDDDGAALAGRDLQQPHQPCLLVRPVALLGQPRLLAQRPRPGPRPRPARSPRTAPAARRAPASAPHRGSSARSAATCRQPAALSGRRSSSPYHSARLPAFAWRTSNTGSGRRAAGRTRPAPHGRLVGQQPRAAATGTHRSSSTSSFGANEPDAASRCSSRRSSAGRATEYVTWHRNRPSTQEKPVSSAHLPDRRRREPSRRGPACPWAATSRRSAGRCTTAISTSPSPPATARRQRPRSADT